MNSERKLDFPLAAPAISIDSRRRAACLPRPPGTLGAPATRADRVDGALSPRTQLAHPLVPPPASLKQCKLLASQPKDPSQALLFRDIHFSDKHIVELVALLVKDTPYLGAYV